jgi:putative membrane protein
MNRTPGSAAHARRLLLLAAGAAAAAPSLALAQAASAPSRSQRPSIDRADRRFIEDAMRDGMAEVELARMAQTRASDAQVKAYAQRMQQDHGKANAELTALANAKFVATDDAKPGFMQRRHADRLARLSGAEFDRAYMEHMVDAHGDAVDLFEKAARDADDADVKAFATRTLPTLRGHLDSARQLSRSGTSAATRSGAASAPR